MKKDEDPWTEHRLELLKDLWGKGITAASIARELGGGLTKNAVVGQAHRLGLGGRSSPIRRRTNEPTPPRRPYKPRQVHTDGAIGVEKLLRQTEAIKAARARALANAAPPVTPRPIEITGRRNECAWPLGDPHAANFHFCGAPVVRGHPYCESHCRDAYPSFGGARTTEAVDV